MVGRLSWLAEIGYALIGAPGCVLCHETPAPSGLCSNCLDDMATLRRPDGCCPGCGRLSTHSVLCGHCQQRPPQTAAVFASYVYAPPISTLLHACKHQHQPTLTQALATLMRQHPPPWLTQYPIDTVLPMPLSRRRLLERGFNQSDLLARQLASQYHWPVLSPLRIQRTPRPPQSTLSQAQRWRNVRGSFTINTDVKNRNVLLIDDVVTTGATIAELARALKKAGVHSVWAWTLARPE